MSRRRVRLRLNRGMDPSGIAIRSTTAQDWRDVRALRLEMLADTPIAYGERLATAEAHGEEEWRMRAQRGQNPHSVQLVAIETATGRWVGTMAGFVDDNGAEPRPMLVGVYVAPSHRGSGVTDALLRSIEEWAATEGDTLYLHVHEGNPRAIGYYEKRGFARTGTIDPYILDPSANELEMSKPLSAAG